VIKVVEREEINLEEEKAASFSKNVQENINGFEKTLLSLIDEEDEQTVITESFTFKAKKIIRSINSNPIKNLQYIFEKNAGNKVSLPLDEVGQT
jgi:succinylglutamate desuccinylase